MSDIPRIGMQVLKDVISDHDFSAFDIKTVRTLDDFQKVACIRAMTYMYEQSCPYEEEFDGNDFSASHFLAFAGNEPVATLRMRWFAGFGKLERICVTPSYRKSAVLKVMIAHAMEVAARKGYRRMLGQIQVRLWPLWSHISHCRLLNHRKRFSFSDFEYCEVEIPLPAHPNALAMTADPFVIIRPEGNWDEPGILEASATRNTIPNEAA